MFRFVIVSLMALGLAACGQQGGQANALQGKWGWVNPDACEGDRDTIEFAGSGFRHRRQGEDFVVGRDVAYQTNDQGWITATYIVDREGGSARTISLTFEPSTAERRNDAGEVLQTYNVLIFRGSVIDGSSPDSASNVMGRPLFNCVDVAAGM